MVKIARKNLVHKKYTFCGGANHSAEKRFKRIRKEKEKYHVAGDLDNRRTERTSRKCFRCRSEDNLISKFLKPPKDNKKRRKKVRFNERGNHASQKESENRENKNKQKIYAYMARMSDNDECPSRNFGDSLQLSNWILDSGATCHMNPEVLDFITGSLEVTDKHIEVADRHHVTVKQKGQSQIKMCGDNGYPYRLNI